MCGMIIGPDVSGLSLSHRGPDETTTTQFDGFQVKSHRLKINGDVQQPCKVGAWSVFLTGEIYNWKDLCPSASNDTHALAILFSHEGDIFDLAASLNGMFVIFAVKEDLEDPKQYIITDRYGIKPFYMYGKYFANESKAFFDIPGFDFSINIFALEQYFTFQNILTDDTIYHGVTRVPPASIISLHEEMMAKYWSPIIYSEDIPYEEAVGEVRRLVIQAIKRQMLCDHGDVGICLSGGIDSSIIALVAKCKSFTCGFPYNDEREFAELLPNDHYEVVVKDNSRQHEAVRIVEDLALGATYSNLMLAEMASKFVKVLFDGSGADEIFMGYTWRYEGDYFKKVNRTGWSNDYTRELYADLFESMGQDRRLWDIKFFLRGLLNVFDKVTSHYGIEGRVPFLDNDLVDYVLRLPVDYLQGKKILKDAFRHMLPIQILDRKKQGFTSPEAVWLKNLNPSIFHEFFPDLKYDHKNIPLMLCMASFEAIRRE